MPSVFKLSPDADRVSRRLREGFGWYPTEKDNSDQLRLFEDVVSRVKHELKAAGVTPSNMRKNLKNIHDISVAEGQKIWAFIGEQNQDELTNFQEVFSSLEACVSYAHAIAFALEACFDAYLKNQRNSSAEQRAADSAPPQQQRDSYTTRSRSRDGDNYDWDGRASHHRGGGGGGGRGGYRGGVDHQRGAYGSGYGGNYGAAHGGDEHRGGYSGKRY
jgi:hypothetical protein